jgi:hypothetical protein
MDCYLFETKALLFSPLLKLYISACLQSFKSHNTLHNLLQRAPAQQDTTKSKLFVLKEPIAQKQLSILYECSGRHSLPVYQQHNTKETLSFNIYTDKRPCP